MPLMMHGVREYHFALAVSMPGYLVTARRIEEERFVHLQLWRAATPIKEPTSGQIIDAVRLFDCANPQPATLEPSPYEKELRSRALVVARVRLRAVTRISNHPVDAFACYREHFVAEVLKAEKGAVQPGEHLQFFWEQGTSTNLGANREIIVHLEQDAVKATFSAFYMRYADVTMP